jgi:hypothetical protein
VVGPARTTRAGPTGGPHLGRVGRVGDATKEQAPCLSAVQLAKLVGVTVIGTAPEAAFEFLRQFGAGPVACGPGLADRVTGFSA